MYINIKFSQICFETTKKLNSKSLLQIYVDYGLWMDAINLVKEYINAILMNDSNSQFNSKVNIFINLNDRRFY